MASPVHLSGQAILDAVITLDRDDAHFALELLEILPPGSSEVERALTRGYQSAQHRETLFQSTPVPPGAPLAYRITTEPMDRVLRAGSRLRLVLSGTHWSGRFPIYPAGSGYTAQVAVDGRSVLQLPLAAAGRPLLLAQ